MSKTKRRLPESGNHRHIIADIIAGSSCHRGGKIEIFVQRFDTVDKTAVVLEASFQGYQGEVNPQVGHKTPGAEERAQIMQLPQEQLAQIVSSAISQALTQHVQETANNPSIAAAASAAAVQQVQTLINLDAPVFEGDSTASWLT